MPLFENFPYTNFHELNLDWLIKKVQDIEASFPEGTIGIEKGGTGATNAVDARTNLGIYADTLHMSSGDSTTISSQLSTLAAALSALSDNINYRIFRTVADVGQTVGTATLNGCYAGMSIGDILIADPDEFTPSEVPETAGSLIMVKNGAASGSLRFYGNRTYEMAFSANYPDGTWKQLINDTDVIPISNGGTGATNAADALSNLGIDFSGTVLSVAGVGANPTGDVPLVASDLDVNYTLFSSITDLGLPLGSTITAVWTALGANEARILFPSSEISDPPVADDGLIYLVKNNTATDGFILYYGKASTTADYRMYLSGSVPSGTWIKVHEQLKIYQVTTASQTIAANNLYDFYIPYTDVPTTGRIIGIVGVGAAGAGSSWCLLFRYTNDSGNSRYDIGMRNMDSNAHTVAARADFLCAE